MPENGPVPPCLDLYLWLDGRDPATIEAFLESYVDVERSTDRGDEELMMLPLSFDGSEDELQLDEWDWQPVATLNEALAAARAEPVRAFRIYLHTATDDLCGVILGFTVEGGTVLGLSIDDPMNEPARLELARSYLDALATAFGGTRGWIMCEEPPPLDPARDEPWRRALAAYP